MKKKQSDLKKKKNKTEEIGEEKKEGGYRSPRESRRH